MLDQLYHKLPEVKEGVLKEMYMSPYRLRDYEDITQSLVIDYILSKMGDFFSDNQFYGKTKEERETNISSWKSALEEMDVAAIIHTLYLVVNAETDHIDFPPKSGIVFRKIFKDSRFSRQNYSSFNISLSPSVLEKTIERTENHTMIANRHLAKMKDIIRTNSANLRSNLNLN